MISLKLSSRKMDSTGFCSIMSQCDNVYHHWDASNTCHVSYWVGEDHKISYTQMNNTYPSKVYKANRCTKWWRKITIPKQILVTPIWEYSHSSRWVYLGVMATGHSDPNVGRQVLPHCSNIPHFSVLEFLPQIEAIYLCLSSGSYYFSPALCPNMPEIPTEAVLVHVMSDHNQSKEITAIVSWSILNLGRAWSAMRMEVHFIES